MVQGVARVEAACMEVKGELVGTAAGLAALGVARLVARKRRLAVKLPSAAPSSVSSGSRKRSSSSSS